MAVKDRIREYIKYKNISITAFCTSIGVSPAYVNSMRQSIQPDKIERIALNYPDLNTGWLLTGAGEMLYETHINKPDIEDYLMKKILEMYNNGEIFPAIVVKQKNEEIANLNKQVALLEAKIEELVKSKDSAHPGEVAPSARTG